MSVACCARAESTRVRTSRLPLRPPHLPTPLLPGTPVDLLGRPILVRHDVPADYFRFVAGVPSLAAWEPRR